ncbi:MULTISPECIES: hypothetical protein [Dyella]|uniref:Uncharacterized protein n=2 Tax=Dyella TaxID=231454 RepID=A0A4R0YT38_9GAMM|nr:MULTISPECIES: hypothetical protein [Dyella]TBR40026.1 hypothetical protein EYV96_07550 [Dyella terrae]TCI12392.1 hypothetical protein EZM97_03320 [Dyella soli]
MAYKNARRVSMGALFGALFQALQWRLLLLWIVLMLIPAIVVALPLMGSLNDMLSHSVHADSFAAGFDALMFGEVVRGISDSSNAIRGAVAAGVIITLLLSPLFNGMIVGSGRAGQSLGFSTLWQSGFVEYGRMFRLMLLSLVPFAIAAFVIKTGSGFVDDKADQAVLEAQATAARHTMMWVTGLVVVLAHVIAESARAAYIADPQLRSALVALGRGFMQLLRRPLSSVFAFLLVSVIGFGIAFALGVARAHTTAFGGMNLLLAFVLTQLVVLAIGWTRIARLFSLAVVARSLGMGRRGAAL